VLRHTRLGKRALTVRELAHRAGLTAPYVRRLEEGDVPLLPEAGARLLGVLLDSPRDEAVAWLTTAVIDGATQAATETMQ
jgi:predicted transcriptional regulator